MGENKRYIRPYSKKGIDAHFSGAPSEDLKIPMFLYKRHTNREGKPCNASIKVTRIDKASKTAQGICTVCETLIMSLK